MDLAEAIQKSRSAYMRLNSHARDCDVCKESISAMKSSTPCATGQPLYNEWVAATDSAASSAGRKYD